MLRRWRARRKMRWAVRWIKRNRYPGYRMRVGRLYGKRVVIYSKPNGVAEGIIPLEAVALVPRHSYGDDEVQQMFGLDVLRELQDWRRQHP